MSAYSADSAGLKTFCCRPIPCLSRSSLYGIGHATNARRISQANPDATGPQPRSHRCTDLINPSHLQALEENDFARLPPLIFARAYLKEYTRCLSLHESQQADLLLRFTETAHEFYGRRQEVLREPHSLGQTKVRRRI
jgi:hypothetical protein